MPPQGQVHPNAVPSHSNQVNQLITFLKK
jgi:hypothetical protein